MRIQHAAPVPPVDVDFEKNSRRAPPVRFLVAVKEGVVNYGLTLYMGAGIVLKNRQFVWLMLGYVLPLVLHRVTESLLFSVFAKQVLENQDFSHL